MDISIKRILLGTLLGIFLLAGFNQVRAQTPPPGVVDVCTGETIPVGTFYTDLSVTGGVFACMPAIASGTGVGFKIYTSLAGVVPYWYCPTADGKFSINFGAATWSRLATGELKADTPLAHESLKAVWCPVRAQMLAERPTTDVWKVAPNSANPTRPTYAFKDGVRTKYTYTNDPRVNVGALCDYSVRVVEGSVTYAQVLPGRVAVCVKQ